MGAPHMEFSAVDPEGHRNRIESSLRDLGDRLAHAAERVAAAPVRAELSSVQAELYQLRSLLAATWPATAAGGTPAEREVGELLTRARQALLVAEEEARQVRDRAYDDALQARRDFEAALYLRRCREARVDDLLRGVVIELPPERRTQAREPAPRLGPAVAAPAAEAG
ncbi:ATPase [Plantactinospora siamensis]|uniref:ATPase n=1 Tax=Plantactinospora siamensis TaxID=555372 RepID=A0ABV6P249_9ACTN